MRCPATIALCKICDRKGHLTKHHRIWAENPHQGKRTNARRTVDEDEMELSIANKLTIDEDEEEVGSYMTWTLIEEDVNDQPAG